MITIFRKLSIALLTFWVCNALYGQSNPPEWFTYPKEGEYVGVSAKLDKESATQDSYVKSAIMSALVSYFLQSEEKNVAYSSITTGNSNGKTNYYESLSELFTEQFFGYELVRLEKDEEGYVWVAIKPITDQKSLSYGRFAIVAKDISDLKEKDGKMSSFNKGLNVSCAYETFSDSIAFNMEWNIGMESGTTSEPASFESFKYIINTDRSPGSVGLDGKDNTTTVNMSQQEKQSAPLERMHKQAVSKGFTGKKPYTSAQSDKGGAYLLALLDALLQKELYVINHDTNRTERKKASKTYATFFSGDECFIFNDTVE